MVLLNKVSLEDFLRQEVLYSKLIRGNLEFKAETHILDGGKELQIILSRNLPLEALDGLKVKETETKLRVEKGVLRLMLNDQKFMINTSGDIDIVIKEKNCERQKVSISIYIYSVLETDNSKLKKEIKDYFMED